MKRGRLVIVILLLVSLLAAAAGRNWAGRLRRKADNAQSVASGSALGRMNSFALALLLGGLRGPLVMILWTSSESQKNERDLEAFDTKVEWIRLLQPEFDSVHIFQVWNKAYNVSVQMASLANKYATILDALDYAYSVDRERPENINILTAIGQVFFDKLGNAAEKNYYRQRVREETRTTLTATTRPTRNRTDPGWRRTEMDPLLDNDGRILPSHQQELRWLKRYEPYPQGLSPFALAFNYYKRAQVLQNEGNQRHIQLSDLVIDSRPALALKTWAEEEWERGRRDELRAYLKPIPQERIDMELPTADAPVGQTPPGNPQLVADAIFDYNRAAQLIPDALTEYEAHLKRFTVNFDTYQSHMDHLRATRDLLLADAAWLQIAASGRNPKLEQSAREHYQKAMRGYLLVVFKYYTDTGTLAQFAPGGITRDRFDTLSTEQLARLAGQIGQFFLDKPDQNAEDRAEYNRYLDRIAHRLAGLGQ